MPLPTGVSREIAAIGRRFHARGWALGTSGNFSAVISRRPLRLAISASAVPKGRIGPAHILEVDAQGDTVARRGAPPSAETLLHLEIVKERKAGAVLHTHSVWATLLSDRHAAERGVAVEGYEMLKGLDGVRTHTHREWIPIFENDQDMPGLARRVGAALREYGDVHAFLLRRHGLYTWGPTLGAAERHVEVLEFLFEAIGRGTMHNRQEGHHGAVEHS